jgi:hypothetical protein
MEFPDRFVNGERRLAVLLLIPVLAAAWLEASSPLAAASRQGRPWACWLAVKSETAALPQIFLSLYRPERRAFELIHVPDTTTPDGKRTLAKALATARKEGRAQTDEEAGQLLADEAAALLSGEGPEELTAALEARRYHFGTAGAWKDEAALEARRNVERIFLNGNGLGLFERARLRLELLSQSGYGINAALLPETKEERTSYFRRLFGPPVADQEGEQPVVEILNSTGEKGIAARLTKLLRSKGADVTSTGNAEARGRTLVIDRVGRPELAARVRDMLGCAGAETVTQIDAKRLVDASVVVAADCAQTE